MHLQFPEFLRTNIQPVHVTMMGEDKGWLAPLGLIDAPSGFGEQAWTDCQPDTVIAFPLGGSTVVCENPGARGATTDSRRGASALQKQGMVTRYRSSGAVRFGHFYVSDAAIAQVAQGLNAPEFSAKNLREDLALFDDHVLRQLLITYRERAIDARLAASRVEMDARALLVVERLITYHHLGRKTVKARGGLAPWQLRRAQEAMTASIDRQISLDDLAAIVGCSATHFSRAFKQSVGVAPFEWLHQRRIERAQELLLGGDLPLAEIALAVGFAAQPQFTTAFGRATGMTPGRWRRERRG